MRLRLIAVGSRMPRWVEEGWQEYVKRLPAELSLERREQRWSLSPLTLPHPLVRILVGEQIYRAWTVLSGHPYHK
nr:23S rRNA (pseudouridine(1915)-N(3))-methyltransferase RlmH [Pseudomonas aeruginosa]